LLARDTTEVRFRCRLYAKASRNLPAHRQSEGDSERYHLHLPGPRGHRRELGWIHNAGRVMQSGDNCSITDSRSGNTRAG
jgi:hypothetical protein